MNTPLSADEIVTDRFVMAAAGYPAHRSGHTRTPLTSAEGGGEHTMRRTDKDLRVAVLAASGVAEADLAGSLEAFRSAGVDADLIAAEGPQIVAWDKTISDWGRAFDIDLTLDQANPDAYGLIFLPGSIMNPDALRTDPTAIDFVCRFFEAGKPVAALCRGPWMMINAGVARGERNRSYHSRRTDVRRFVDNLVQRDPLPGDEERPLHRTTHLQMILWEGRSSHQPLAPRRPRTRDAGVARVKGGRWVCPV